MPKHTPLEIKQTELQESDERAGSAYDETRGNLGWLDLGAIHRFRVWCPHCDRATEYTDTPEQAWIHWRRGKRAPWHPYGRYSIRIES